MIRTARIALTVFAAVATLAFFPPDGSARPYNQSSHPPEFFRDLLAGRVFVYRHRINGYPAAKYFDKNSNVLLCWFSPKQNQYVIPRSPPTWAIGTPTGPSNYELRWTNNAGQPRHRRRVVIYNPDTGQFHFEAYFKKSKRWEITQNGWLQDSWPSALANGCSHLDLPADLTINQRQDSVSFEHMKANATPIRNHPGSDIRFPGATGIGAAGNKPTTTPEQFHALIRAFHGFLLQSNKGRWQLFNMLPDRPEAWLLDSDHDLIDTATVSLTENNTLLTTTWDRLGIKRNLHVGYPIPLLSTGKLHPAFAMMKDLTGSPRPVPLAGEDANPVPHVFRPDGTLTARHSTGSWHISKGAIHVEIAGTSRAFPWREFAKLAAWKN